MGGGKIIPVSEPALVGNERAYVLKCLDSGYISRGEYVPRFEQALAELIGVDHAISCCSGTAALHLALLALGVGPGDEVILPTLTYVATANAVTYCGACPVFVDSEPETCNLDPAVLEDKITSRTQGIIAVHLYGHPADMQPVLQVARRHGLFVLEDASEALGAQYRGQPVGSIGDVATFSFHALKMITTGEGGIVTCRDAALAHKIGQLRDQGRDSGRRHWFPVVGYNYRMTNIAAAIGLAQLEKLSWHIDRRRENAVLYRELLGGRPWLTVLGEQPWAKHAWWLNCVILSEGVQPVRDQVIAGLGEKGIEAWPFFYPLHTLPMYSGPIGGRAFPVAEALAARGICLPSSARLSCEDIRFVADTLVRLVK